MTLRQSDLYVLIKRWAAEVESITASISRFREYDSGDILSFSRREAEITENLGLYKKKSVVNVVYKREI